MYNPKPSPSILIPTSYAGYAYYLGFDYSLKSLEYLNLNLRLGDILLAPSTIHNLAGLSQLGTDGLSAEILERVGLDSIDAQLGVWLDDSEAARDYIRVNQDSSSILG